MHAYRERVYLCPEKNGQPVSIREFPLWWDRRGFFEHFGPRRIDTGHPIYVDYGLLLSRQDASTWGRQARAAFADDPRNDLPVVRAAMQQWETLLAGTRWLIVESYEWESGLA